MDKIRLFSYKMTNDNGFAPNPFHGILTLANCKPSMRRSKKIGDWIAGFTSKELNRDKVKEERLVYLTKVTDRISYNEYWNNPIYKCKIPDLNSSKTVDKAGDNIYKPIKDNPLLNSDYIQIKNMNHGESDKNHDLDGNYVLISDCFFYFGSSPIKIDKEIRPSVPIGSSPDGNLTENDIAQKFINFIQNNYQTGVINMPHSWPKDNSENQKNIKKCK